MSKLVEARELRPRDLFEMPNGSVYAIAAHAEQGATPRARLWCAHPPDAIAFDPPLVDLPPGRQVRLLTGNETRDHYRHDGYVESVFNAEMDRRHGAAMQVYDERRRLEVDEERQRTHARRPWWKNVFDALG